jgi:hypothetical protein
MKHKHAEIIKAWADGAEIETKWKNADSDWYPQEDFLWFIRSEFADKADFRIKPEPKPDVVKYLICGLKSWVEVDDQIGHDCIKIVIDSKGRLKSAEVLK